MGSLVPGWDAVIVIPRDLASDSDIDRPPQPEGYFAKLRSHRRSSGGPAEGAAAQTLSRISAPQSLTQGATTKRARMQPASTLAQAGNVPHAHQFTDWSEELNTLRKPGLGCSSMGAYSEKYDQDRQGGSAWWRALEVGQLNVHPDVVPSFGHGTPRSTFVPQFIQSAKLEFGEDVAPAGDGK